MTTADACFPTSSVALGHSWKLTLLSFYAVVLWNRLDYLRQQICHVTLYFKLPLNPVEVVWYLSAQELGHFSAEET